ncbi:MAG: hypothetical protein IKO32_10295, partial [Lachnospiraceae bacterium]|nr:hypothetical protein [Lachnospiraceae bacterium]
MGKRNSFHFKRRAKETLAMLLSILMVLSVVFVPIKADAYKGYSSPGVDEQGDPIEGDIPIPEGTVFFPGDGITFLSCYGRVLYGQKEISQVNVPFELGEYATEHNGNYYKNGPFEFPVDLPNGSYNSYIYEYDRQDTNGNYRTVWVEAMPGYQIKFDGQNDDSEHYIGMVYSGGEYLNDTTDSSFLPYLEADTDLGDFVGWSTSKEYKAEGSFFARVGNAETDVFDCDTGMGYLDEDGILTLYPIYEYAKLSEDFSVSLEDYDYTAERLPAPQISGVASDRDVELEYFNEEGDALGERPMTPGKYSVKATALKVLPVYSDADHTNLVSQGQPQLTATDEFEVTGPLEQDEVEFNPPDECFVGQDIDPDACVTGVKDNAEIHFQFRVPSGEDYTMSEKDTPLRSENADAQIRFIVDATETYSGCESGWYELPVSYLPWPDAIFTTDKESVGTYSDGTDTYDVFKGPVRIYAPEDFEFITDNQGYSEYIDATNEGMVSAHARLRRKEDHAETAEHIVKQFWNDLNAPFILTDSGKADGEIAGLTVSDDGTVEITAKKLEFDVADYNKITPDSDYGDMYDYGYSLDSVTVAETGGSAEIETIRQYPSRIGKIAHVTLTNGQPGTKTYTVKAKDVAGRESTWKISLTYPGIDAPEPPYTVSGTEGERGYYL